MMHWWLNGTWYAFSIDLGVLVIYGFFQWIRGKK